MPKFPTFERIFQSGNTVSFRLMNGEKGQELHMSQNVDPFVRLLTILLKHIFIIKIFIRVPLNLIIYYKIDNFMSNFYDLVS